MNLFFGGNPEKAKKLLDIKVSLNDNMKNGLSNARESYYKIKDSIDLPIFIYLIVIILLIIAIVIWWRWREPNRLPKLLLSLETYPKFVNIKPLTSLNNYVNAPKPYLLCDWYIASSYKSFLPGLQYFDYCSTKTLEILLRSGVRFIDLDIYNNDHYNDIEPIVTIGKAYGNWHYTLNTITFSECCKIIRNIGLSKSAITNATDPLFINLNLHVNGNLKTLNRISNIIYNTFDKKLLNKRYGYSRRNLTIEPINNFINKVIIICGKGHKNSRLSELINLSLNSPFIRKFKHLEVIETHEPDELKEYNKLNMSIVYPDFDKRESLNYNPTMPWTYGCQFVLMNYQTMDTNMNSYISKFKSQSFVLKPYNLRYHPKTYKKPKPQKKKLYYNTLQMKTQFYDYKI